VFSGLYASGQLISIAASENENISEGGYDGLRLLRQRSEVLHVRNRRERDSGRGRGEHGVNPAKAHGVLPIPLVHFIDRADPVPLFVVLYNKCAEFDSLLNRRGSYSQAAIVASFCKRRRAT